MDTCVLIFYSVGCAYECLCEGVRMTTSRFIFIEALRLERPHGPVTPAASQLYRCPVRPDMQSTKR